jgi:geranylgeranyl diphosphate synthase type II
VPAPAALDTYLDACRALALEELERVLPQYDGAGRLYALMRDYPFRRAKGLRPALAIATCRALGGPLEGVLPSAAVLELYHNAFLIHDDVEDGSTHRRGGPTLHRAHGTPVAVNVGDGMLAVALKPLLDNLALLGIGPSLRILQLIARMSRETAEGQAQELAWIRDAQLPTDRAYLRMVYQKTSWYSFVAPMLVGAVCAGADDRTRRHLFHAAVLLGAAFQITDDVLNLTSETGKERDGDLWEGKRTLIVLHALRSVDAATRAELEAVLRRPRPVDAPLWEQLHAEGHLDAVGLARARALVGQDRPKTDEDVQRLRQAIDRTGSLDHARRIALDHAQRARRRLATLSAWPSASTHRDFLVGLADFVVERSV